MHLNIEFKARCREPSKVRGILEKYNAKFVGKDYQIDTYFCINNGRLKLREGNIENNLIFYQRNDQKGPKNSLVTLLNISPETNLKDILTKALGIKVVVNKRREIYFIDNIKFHIDNVKDLGHFVEVEAIDKNGMISEENLRAQCNKYLEEFNIKEEDLISSSYSDLLLQKIKERRI